MRTDGQVLILIICGITALLIVAVIISHIRKSPFKYPYFIRKIDVSGKRSPQITELIDEYLIRYQMTEIDAHEHRIQQWKTSCLQTIAQSHFPKLRRRQYEEALDDDHAYRFVLFRMQTRYRQQNYRRCSYQVENVVGHKEYDYWFLADRNARLSKIGYETSLKKYYSKEQRKQMTPVLRKEIMERDNYTCQICGRYMPDEVGLHIDHIVPIAKGGKSVPSNLQVLCSKCNGRKRDKMKSF